MDPIHSDYLHYEAEQAKQIEEFKELVKVAGKICELFEQDGWKHFEEFLDEAEKSAKRIPSFYFKNPEYAGYDAGIVYAITSIREFISMQKKLISDNEEYEQKEKASEEAVGEEEALS